MPFGIDNILYDPTIGKIAAIMVGIGLVWLLIRLIQRALFSKIKDNENRYRAKKFSSFIAIG